MRTSRRYQLRLREPLASELDAFARAHTLGACPAIRLLVSQALEAERSRHCSSDSPAALAALVAAELAALMVASVLPDGERRMHEMASQAAIAAEARLAMFREAEL